MLPINRFGSSTTLTGSPTDVPSSMAVRTAWLTHWVISLGALLRLLDAVCWASRGVRQGSVCGKPGYEVEDARSRSASMERET